MLYLIATTIGNSDFMGDFMEIFIGRGGMTIRKIKSLKELPGSWKNVDEKKTIKHDKRKMEKLETTSRRNVAKNKSGPQYSLENMHVVLGFNFRFCNTLRNHSVTFMLH